MNRLQQYVFGKLGKLKHEIDLEAHAYDRLYWMDLRQRGMKEDLEKLKERVAELEKPGMIIDYLDFVVAN